jgi:hypothetical protein
MTQFIKSPPVLTTQKISVVQGWATHVTDMAQRLGSYFARAKTCQWVMTYLQPGKRLTAGGPGGLRAPQAPPRPRGQRPQLRSRLTG